MTSGQRSSRRRRRYGWHQPAWRDPAFWVAVVITVLAIIAQALFIQDRSSWLSWAGLALQAAITWIVVSALIRIRIGMRRGLIEGFAEAERQRQARPSGRSAGETLARTGGRTLGRAMAAYKRSQQPKP